MTEDRDREHRNREQRNRMKTVAAGVLLMMAYGFIGNTLGFFVVPVSEGLGVSRAAFNLYFTILSIVGLIVAPFFGQLYKRVEISYLILFGLVVGAVTFTVMSFAPSIGVFYVAGILLGLVQQSTTSVAAVVMINRVFGDTAGSAMGTAMAGTGVISMVMSFVLPAVIGRFSWRGGYRLQAVLWLVFLGTAAFLLRGVSRTLGGDRKEAKAAASAGASGMTLAETLRLPVFYGLFGCICVLSVNSVFIHHMPAYYADRGFSQSFSGMMVAGFNLFLIPCKILAGRLYDRIGCRVVAPALAALMAGGLWLMSASGAGVVAAGTLLFAFGMPTITVIFPLVARYVFGGCDDAAIWSVLSMAVSLGTASGSPFWGAVYDLSGSYLPAMRIVPVIGICAAIGIWLTARGAGRRSSRAVSTDRGSRV